MSSLSSRLEVWWTQHCRPDVKPKVRNLRHTVLTTAHRSAHVEQNKIWKAGKLTHYNKLSYRWVNKFKLQYVWVLLTNVTVWWNKVLISFSDIRFSECIKGGWVCIVWVLRVHCMGVEGALRGCRECIPWVLRVHCVGVEGALRGCWRCIAFVLRMHSVGVDRGCIAWVLRVHCVGVARAPSGLTVRPVRSSLLA